MAKSPCRARKLAERAAGAVCADRKVRPLRSVRRPRARSSIMPAKKSSAATLRRCRWRCADAPRRRARSATSGISALGSACATEPQIVPRLRVWRARPTAAPAPPAAAPRRAGPGSAVRPGARRRRSTTAPALSFDVASSLQPHDVDQHFRLRQAHIQHRHQRLAAGKHARIAAFRRKYCKDFVERSRRGHSRTAAGFIARPPNRPRISRPANSEKPPAAPPPALRASAAKNCPMMTRVRRPAGGRRYWQPCRRWRRHSS